MNEDPTNPNDVSRLTNDPAEKADVETGMSVAAKLEAEAQTGAEIKRAAGVFNDLLSANDGCGTETEIMRPKQFKEGCFGFRSDIELLKKQVKNWMRHPVFDDLPPKADPMEMAPNLMLAYRHLEDARMRVGKAIQAFEGGKSVYPQ